ncbi:hypothetical protein ACUH7A_003479, partial [Yersinia enterocolitica]
TSGNIRIDIIISKDDEELFKVYQEDEFCHVKYIEDLIREYSHVDISAADLLRGIGKFRFQALKKILGVFFCETKLALVVDSETNIVRDLNEMFKGGVENTTVLYSLRKWDKIPESLTTSVRTEVNYLLGQSNDYWFFESFNWIYDVDLLKCMLASIEEKLGKEWIFRNNPLFECQLYYQYAFNSQSQYQYIRVEDLFIKHFGPSYGQKIIDRFWSSTFTFCGIIEYAAHLMTKDEYISFVTNPEITHHLRLIRHEPPFIYNVVDIAREKSPKDEYYGEAAMHRGDFTRGRIAVLISGEFHSFDNILNVKNFLAGVDCDVFVTIQKNSHLVPIIDEVLSPVEMAESDDELRRGDQSIALALSEGAPEIAVKAERDIGVSNMFDKLSVTYQMMRKHELAASEEYSIIVRIRPDIFATNRLKDVFFNVAENSQVDDQSIFFPDRFWSQGINDQFFFGKSLPMKLLLDNISGDNYVSSEYLNPEYYLGRTLLKEGLKPIAFEFKYILMRNQGIEIDNIQCKLDNQENLFWSKTIPYPCWKDLSAYLKNNLDNILVKNAQLEVSRILTFRRKDVEFFYCKAANGNTLVFTSEHKSPYVHVSQVHKILVPFLSYLIVFGYPYSITDINNVLLKSYDKKTNQLKISKGKYTEIESVTFYTPKPSFLAWGIVQVAKKCRRVLLSLLRR